MYESTKWTFNISDEDHAIARNNYAMTLNKMISKYGEEGGRKRWEEYCEKQRVTKSWEYMVEKYGEEKA